MADHPTDPSSEPMPAEPWAARTTMDVLEVAGVDAAAYLQGQLSQDVAGLAVGGWAHALLLEPQGKMCAWMRVHRAADEAFDLVVDAGFGELVEQRLRRFWLRTKAELTVRPGVPALAVRNWPVGQTAPDPTVGSNVEATPADRRLLAPVDWPRHRGFDVIGAGAVAPDGVRVIEGDVGAAALLLARVEAGVPAMGSEIGPDTIPAAAGVVEASVSFTKGCYTGQELVARVDSRGNRTPNRLVRLAGEGTAPEPGTQLSVDGTERAVVTSAVTDVSAKEATDAVPHVGAWQGLGYLHRSVETPAELRTSANTSATAVAIERSDVTSR